jgi:hypothetical protein
MDATRFSPASVVFGTAHDRRATVRPSGTISEFGNEENIFEMRNSTLGYGRQ